MTPRAYETARRMAADPRTPKHERDNAARRVAEYEAKHGKPQPPPKPPTGISCRCGHHRDKHKGKIGPCGVNLGGVGRRRTFCSCRGFDPSVIGWWSFALAWTRETFHAIYLFRQEVELGGGGRGIWGYGLPGEVAERIRRGEVDWTGFPEQEPTGRGWRIPREAIEAIRKARKRDFG